MYITGSALALHCCKIHAKINRKIENSTPCKIVTHEGFNLKLGTRDYVIDVTHHATLGSNRSSGGFLPNRRNITLLWPFVVLYLFLGHTPSGPGRTVAPILTLCGSNDVFPPKDGPFGGHGDRWRHMDKYAPKTPPKGAWIGSFKPKRQNLYIAISPELLIRRTSDLTIELRRRKALRWWSAITPKQIQHGWWPPSWKSSWYLIFDLIFRRWMIQFGWNSTARCRTTRQLRRNGRYRNRK